MAEATAMMSDHDWRRVGAVYSARRRSGSRGIRYMEIFKGFKPKPRQPLSIDALADYSMLYQKRRKLRMVHKERMQRTVWQWQERNV